MRGDMGEVRHYVATLSDLSEAKAAESTIQRLAFYDPLTGLPNRRLLLDRLGQVISHSRRRNHYASLLLVGLDNFKAYNTTLGHASGDTLLRRLAEVLRGSLRESDTLARWGGDQFALLVQDLGDEPAHAARGPKGWGRSCYARSHAQRVAATRACHSRPASVSRCFMTTTWMAPRRFSRPSWPCTKPNARVVRRCVSSTMPCRPA